MVNDRIKKCKKATDPLVGAWVNGDEYETNIEYIIAQSGRSFTVRAIDRYDGEEARVYDVCYDNRSSTLSFATYWNSTGRLLKVNVKAISPDRISYTYTFTENQMWFRKETERYIRSKRSKKRE